MFYFPYIGNFIIPTDELIFFRGVGPPPTCYCVQSNYWLFTLVAAGRQYSCCSHGSPARAVLHTLGVPRYKEHAHAEAEVLREILRCNLD